MMWDRKIKTMRLIAITSLMGLLLSLSASAQFELGTQYTFDALNTLWNQNVGDNSFDASWFANLAEGQARMSSGQKAADSDVQVLGRTGLEPAGQGSDMLGGAPGGMGFDPMGGLIGEVDPLIGEEDKPVGYQTTEVIYLPVLEMPKQSMNQIYRRKALLNVYLARSGQYRGVDAQTKTVTVGNVELSPAGQAQLVQNRSISTEAELFLLAMLEFFSASSLEEKCLLLSEAKTLMESVEASLGAVNGTMVGAELAATYEAVKSQYADQIESATICKLKETFSRSELKSRIEFELILPALREKIRQEIRNNLKLVDGVSTGIDSGDVEQMAMELAGILENVLELKRQAANAQANLDLVSQDSLGYFSKIKNQLAQETVNLGNILNEEPTIIAELQAEVVRFVENILAGIRDIQSVEADWNATCTAGNCNDSCKYLDLAFCDFANTHADTVGCPSNTDYVFGTVGQSFPDLYEECLDKIVEITGQVASSDLETKRTAEFARRVDDLSYCVAKTRYDETASCALNDKEARSILKCN